jgi:hypothetical protein
MMQARGMIMTYADKHMAVSSNHMNQDFMLVETFGHLNPLKQEIKMQYLLQEGMGHFLFMSLEKKL